MIFRALTPVTPQPTMLPLIARERSPSNGNVFILNQTVIYITAVSNATMCHSLADQPVPTGSIYIH